MIMAFADITISTNLARDLGTRIVAAIFYGGEVSIAQFFDTTTLCNHLGQQTSMSTSYIIPEGKHVE